MERHQELKILNRAVEKWGKLPQTIVAMEEMAELIKELSKDLRGNDNAVEIAEEIADVEIMLDQLKIIHDVGHLVNVTRHHKLVRLDDRLNKD